MVVRYDNGAIATAEASFCAMYGYDLRGEVFGSAGMVQMGEIPNAPTRLFTSAGMSADTAGTDTSRFHEAYRDELRAFAGLLNGDDAPPLPGCARRPAGAAHRRRRHPLGGPGAQRRH